MLERREQREFLAGVLAAAVMTIAMVVLRLVSGAPSLPELIGDGIISVMPAAIFSKLLDLLLRAAKPTLVVCLLVGQLAVGGFLGRLYAREPGWRRMLAIVAGAWLVVGLLVLPLLGLGPFASARGAGPLYFAASILAVFLIFGVALVLFHSLLLPSEAGASGEVVAVSRRSAMTKLGLSFAAVVVGGYGWRALVGATPGSATGASTAQGTPATPAADSAAGRPTAVTSFSPAPGQQGVGLFAVPGLPPEVTPTKDFYTVSKNFVDPTVDVGGWKLTIYGLVERPMTFDYEAIQKLGAVSDFYTLQCISNPVGGDLWGNAHWTGVRLADLLQPTGLKAGIRKVVFHAADDYTDSITLERAVNQGAILAYQMNGAPLTREHGFPARLLIPNIYGMKNVKWITRIELVDYDFKGYWMQRGWDDAAPYKVSSRIDVPVSRATPAAGEVPIGGVAFAGERGIRLVEYSLDDGTTWQAAELKPALATNTWQLWVARPAVAPGKYTIKVRATDGKGDLQSWREQEPLPDGASGYHTIVIGVA